MKKIIIAIDGYSSCGKSTMARELARAIGYIYIDTGAMYRAVTYYAIKHGLKNADGTIKTAELEHELSRIDISFSLNAETGKPDTYLNGELVEKQIRSLEVSNSVSMVAALPFVRRFLVQKQQQMGTQKGIVMDGRDIGTTVFPDAELKIFVTADAAVRAQRRYDELTAKGIQTSYDDILASINERDKLDTEREVSPLRKAPDALLLDNSHMTIAQQRAWLIARYEQKVAENEHNTK